MADLERVLHLSKLVTERLKPAHRTRALLNNRKNSATGNCPYVVKNRVFLLFIQAQPIVYSNLQP